MLILKADRPGTTARVPVSYPVLFQTDWYLDEGEVLDLSLRVEVAKVRWADGNRYGLEFFKMPEADKDRLLGRVKNFYA